MFLLPRSLRRRLSPKLFFLLLTLLLIYDYQTSTSLPHPTRSTHLPPHLQNKKIYIASIHRNSEYMLRLYWSSRLVSLIKTLGAENVFVSVLESGSIEDTKGALGDLKEELDGLGVQNRILLGMTAKEQVESLATREQGMEGWVKTGRGKGWEVRRIPYLAELRNKAMEALWDLKKEGKEFDLVLWVNDVVFSTEDVITLLSTRDGSYAAACALDFSGNHLKYYDTFALRDSSGLKTATQTYPYFTSSSSRRGLSSLSPVPVQSCWNGIIAMDASPFYTTPPLTFRGIPDSLAAKHLEGSECCLIHSDNDKMRREKGVWLNPNVRVAYNASSYSKVNGGVEVRADMANIVDGVEGGDGRRWPGKGEMWRGVWENRRVRLFGWLKRWSEEKVVRNRVSKWIEEGKEKGEDRREIGMECLVNEMQVLFESGWMHV